MTKETTKINLTVNGTQHQLEITPDTKLADVLRRDPSGKGPSGRGLGLTGTKIASNG
jgi:aerobic-type carbon monoxide dehydrogenase small subunit (CoxS/CutS family)